MHVKKGDNVIVLTGKDKGKKGPVLKALPKAGKVLIEGVNMVKRHQRTKKAGGKGEILTVTRPIDASNVRLVDKKKKEKKNA
ncbi:50S ribosomal protein L24 [Candidatus Parcubacteria bacterium]|nr:50S ribosomal protein L24 [Candidatus Parcubacteria bacterium]